MELWLPYGETEVVVRVPAENLLGVADAKEPDVVPDPHAEVNRALENPIGGVKLGNLVKAGCKIAIVVEDEIEPTQRKAMLLTLLKRLNELGIENKTITVIAGHGLYKPARTEGLQRLFGEGTADGVRVINHDPRGRGLLYIGKTTLKTKVYINRAFAEADLRILTGSVGFHPYAGYRGGRTGVLPAISGLSTIQHNCSLLVDPKAMPGNIDGNPVHLDMTEAAHLAGVHFILNVATNAEGRIIKAFAGDMDKAFLEGAGFIDEVYKVPVERAADVVIVSPGGYGKDASLYEAFKVVNNVLGVVKDGGVVILVAECSEGYGNEKFYDWVRGARSLKDVERMIRRGFVPGGEGAYYLLKALSRVKVILVSVMPEYYSRDVFKLKTARSVNEALRLAFKMIGRRGKVLVVPHGSTTLPSLQI